MVMRALVSVLGLANTLSQDLENSFRDFIAGAEGLLPNLLAQLPVDRDGQSH